ncbi:hypothetical protein P4U90_00590 [Cytobacillus kochii]|uniref:hypothetical protein n=1 Tax=Cytobacillus kochii TaxID=859143 RepID=UPI002E2290DD|nr:hypothetical protein [Cytobacillus kochii]
MNASSIDEIINKLKNKEIEEYYVKKEDFLTFRSVIVKREDFKYIRGIAQRGGDVIYQYLTEPRS